MNPFKTANLHAPIAWPILFALAPGGEPIATKAVRKQVLALIETEDQFYSKKCENGRMTSRLAAREQARSYSLGQGEAPRNSPDEAERIAEMVSKQIRSSWDSWYDTACRPVLIPIFEVMLQRAVAAAAELARRHEVEAESLGLKYVKPPVVRSAERNIELLEKDLHNLTNVPQVRNTVSLLLRKRLGIEVSPAAAAEPK